jgi:hypothetical protein
MRGVRSPRWALVALAVGLVAGALGAGVAPGAAPAASPHRAAIIIDTGSSVKRVVVTFGEDSITGLDALQRAGASPVVYQFGGQGGAVCRLFGVGRDSGPNCLGGADGDPRYWAYFKAPAGSSSFKYSSVGAGTARVRDGDVEGWRFGTGAAPQYVSLASLVAPPPPPPTQPPATVSPTGPGGANPTPAGVASESTGPPGSATGPGPASSATTLPQTGGTGTTASTRADGTKSDRDDTKGDGKEGAASERDDGTEVDTALASSDSGGGGGGGSAWSFVLFGVLLAGIAAAIVAVRRVRRHAEAG